MGKIVVTKNRGMSLWAKFALVTLSSLLLSAFIDKPAFALNPLMHNSSTAINNSGRSWGLDKDCTWCHSATKTSNVKKVLETINTPSGARKVVFYRMTAVFNNQTGVLGNDLRTYSGNGVAGSANICEVCHRNTSYHQYSAKSSGHYDNQLCTSCHQHADGFRPQGHEIPYYAATGVGHPTCAATGCHANVNPAATYPTAGSPPDCRACHVTDDPKVAGNRCVSCHGDPDNQIDAHNGQPSGNTYPNVAGSHAAHMSGFVQYTSGAAVTCTNCHTSGGSGGRADHGKGNRGQNAAVVNLNPSFGLYSSVTGLTCNTASCHANPYSSALIASPSWGETVGCAACHKDGGAFSVVGAPDTGSHTAHSDLTGPGTGSICVDCHDGAERNVTGGAQHLDGNVDVGNGYQSNVTKHIAGNGYSSCSAASCHASPYKGTLLNISTVTTPVWGVATGCAACHRDGGAFIANGAPATGSHAVHMTLPVAACNDCHEAALAASYQSPNHKDGDIDVIGGYPANVAKHVAGSGYGSCSAAACHASPYGTTSIPSPSWGVSAGCATCHKDGGAFQNSTGHPRTGSHSVHMSLIGSACNQCHDGAVKWVGGGLTHPDSKVDVNSAYTASPVTKHTAGTYTGYCMSASCHVSPYGAGPVDSPVWGVATGCSSCHNGTGAFTGTGAPATGSHAKHMALPGVACAECHSGAVSGASGGNNHSNGFVNVSSGYTYSPVPRHPIGTYDGTCANQCHTDGNGLSVPSSKWGVAMSANCTGCHGGAANVIPASKILATGKHRSHINNYTTLGAGNNFKCAECHAKTTALASDIALSGPGHVNQYKDYSGVKAGGSSNYSLATGVCSTVYCHSNGQPVPRYKNMTGSKAWAGNAKFNCSGCHGSEPGATWASDYGAPNYPNKYDGTLKTANSHERHNVLAGATDSRSCAKCHVTSVDETVAGKLRNYSTTHLNKVRDVSFAIYGRYSTTNRSCNTYCHSNVQAPGGNGPATQYAAPVWGDNNSMTCGSCHKDMANLTETAENLQLGSHRRHVAPYSNLTSGSIGAGYDCSVCHGSSYTATSADTVTHANGTIDTLFTGKNASGTTYSQAAGNLPGETYGTCSTSKCHGRATRNWGISTTDRVCEKCHGSSRTAIVDGVFKDTAGSPASPYTGTHLSHLAGTHRLTAPMQCNQCHVVPSSLNSFGHMTTLPAPISWGNLSARQSIIRGYTSATPIMTPTYSAGSRQCSNTYCHAGVQIKNATTGEITYQGSKPNPTWADAGYLAGTGCNMCHGYPPGGQHPTSTICSGCHAHVDQSNLAFVQNDPVNNIDVRNHLNGIINVTEDDCLGCHSSTGCTPAEELAGTCFSRELVGGHDTHTNSELFLKNLDLSNKKLSAGDYIDSTWIYGITYKKGFPQYACGFCHPMDVALHKNGVVEVDLDPTHAFRGSVKTKNLAALPTPPAGWYNTWLKTYIPGTVNESGGYVSGSVVCSNVYCHSTGYISQSTNNYQFKETPDWYYADSHGGTSAWAGQDACAKCHGNSPNTNGNEGSSAHARHVVANHFKDVFDGYSAKLKYAGKPGTGAVHGDPATATNFNCNVCHFDTVRVAFNDKGSVCIDCHASPRKASLLNYSAVGMGKMVVYSGSTKHVNGDVDVAFMEPFAVKSKAQVRDSISAVQSIYTSWTRVNGYKNANSYDIARMKPVYEGGTCSTTACHNNTLMEWRTQGPLTCAACHNGLPQ